MRWPASIILALSAVASAQDRAAGTNIVYQTGIITNNAWTRSVISELVGSDGVAQLRDRKKAFVSAADLAALGVVTEDAHKVAEAWTRGFSQGAEVLASAMSNYVDNGGTFLKLTYPLIPSATRRSVDIFVVSNTYDAVRNRDCLWIYFSRELPMKPAMSLPYVWEGGFTTNRVTGTFSVADVAGSHWTNTVTITRFRDGLGNPIVYAECHRCWFTRPADLRGVPIHLYRHGSFGSKENGVEWGSIAVTVDGTPTFTGQLTNSVDHTVSTWSNGGLLGITQMEETDE